MGSVVADRPRELCRSETIWFAAGAITILVCVLYANILADLAAEWWTQPEASYGMLIPPFAFFVAWLKRRETLSIPVQPEPEGLIAIGCASLLLLTGSLASEFFLARISFVLLLGGLVWTFWGRMRLRSLAFPLTLLLTMVPPPALLYNAAAAPLQLFASKIATDVAQLLGVSIYRDGNIIHLATISLGVAEACSGLHSLSALAVAALILGFLENASLSGRVAVFVLSVPLAILVNVLRVCGTAVLADYRPEFAIGYYHAFSGWFVFVIGFGVLWAISKAVFHWTAQV